MHIDLCIAIVESVNLRLFGSSGEVRQANAITGDPSGNEITRLHRQRQATSMNRRTGAVGEMTETPVRPFRRETSSGACPAAIDEKPKMNGHPQQSLLELAALPTAVPCARLHARQVLWEWGLHALADDVELIVSELFTNSLHAIEAIEQRAVPRWSADVPCIELRLYSPGGGDVVVQVWDPIPQPPVLQGHDGGDISDLAESGRGLLLVGLLSKRWGYYPTPTADQAELFALQERLSELRGGVLVEPRCVRSVGKVVWAMV